MIGDLNRVSLDQWIEGDPFAGEIELEEWSAKLWEDERIAHILEDHDLDDVDSFVNQWEMKLYEKGYEPEKAASIISRAYSLHIGG